MTVLDELGALALAVADGAVIDWDRLLDGKGGPAEVAALRLIEAIAVGHGGAAEPDEASSIHG